MTATPLTLVKVTDWQGVYLGDTLVYSDTSVALTEIIDFVIGPVVLVEIDGEGCEGLQEVCDDTGDLPATLTEVRTLLGE